VVTLLRPVLIERGLIYEDYAVPGGTFRENLLRQPGQHHLRPDYYGSKFNYKEDDVKVAKKENGVEKEKKIEKLNGGKRKRMGEKARKAKK